MCYGTFRSNISPFKGNIRLYCYSYPRPLQDQAFHHVVSACVRVYVCVLSNETPANDLLSAGARY